MNEKTIDDFLQKINYYKEKCEYFGKIGNFQYFVEFLNSFEEEKLNFLSEIDRMVSDEFHKDLFFDYKEWKKQKK